MKEEKKFLQLLPSYLKDIINISMYNKNDWVDNEFVDKS